MSVSYKIRTELKKPWFGKPYVEYQLVKYWEESVMDCWGDGVKMEKVIYHSKYKYEVEGFLRKLEEV